MERSNNVYYGVLRVMTFVSVLTLSTLTSSVGGVVNTIDPNGCNVTWIETDDATALSGMQISNTTTTSQDACLQYCVNYPACTGVDWNTATTDKNYGCWVHNTTIGQLYDGQGTTNQFTFSRANCPSTTARASTTQRVAYATQWFTGGYINGTWYNATYINVTYYESGGTTAWAPVLGAASTLESLLTTGVMTVVVVMTTAWMSVIGRS